MPDLPAQILSTLAQERAALAAGRWNDLDAIGAAKIKLCEAMRQQGCDKSRLVLIERQFQRNAKLLAAALAGIKSAQSRLDALLAVRNGLSIYGAGGQKETVAVAQQKFEHKA